MRRYFSNTAPPLEITAAVDMNVTVFPVVSTAGYPDAPFLIGIERDSVNEEVCLCTGKTPTAFTVTRGYDGTTAKAHALGRVIEHCAAALDYEEANRHIFDSTRDDHPQYYNAARLASARTEIWTNSALPTTGNFEGRVVFATGLANANFRSNLYCYRGGAWRLVTPLSFGAASAYVDGDWVVDVNQTNNNGLPYQDLGAAPCTLIITQTIFVSAYTDVAGSALGLWARDVGANLSTTQKIAQSAGVNHHTPVSISVNWAKTVGQPLQYRPGFYGYSGRYRAVAVAQTTQTLLCT